MIKENYTEEIEEDLLIFTRGFAHPLSIGSAIADILDIEEKTY